MFGCTQLIVIFTNHKRIKINCENTHIFPYIVCITHTILYNRQSLSSKCCSFSSTVKKSCVKTQYLS